MKHCRKVHTTPYTYRCLASLFTKLFSTRKLTQTIAFGLLLLASALTTSPVSAQVPDATVVNICSRTAFVRSLILGRIPATSDCNLVTAGQLRAITGTFNLAGRSITSLQADDFAELTGITVLSLANNSLSTLPAGLFNDLTSLTQLLLHGNNLATLPFDIFDPVPNSATIQIDLSLFAQPELFVGNGDTRGFNLADNVFISRNSLGNPRNITYSGVSSADPAVATVSRTAGALFITGVMDGTTTVSVTATDGTDTLTQTIPIRVGAAVSICDRTAEVEAAILAAIPTTIPLDCSSIGAAQLAAIANADLTLNASSITSLQANDFAGLSGITVLNLSDNDLTTLVDNTFTGLDALTGLNLSGNDLSTFSGGTFSGLSSLTSLNLSGNSLTTLPANVFSDLGMLTVLNLRGNAITTLPANAFSGLSVLSTLDLRDSTLSASTSLSAGTFTGLDALTELNLRATSLMTLPADVFDPISTLTILDLQFNSLSTLPNDLFDSLSALARLNLNNNGLSALPSSLSDLTMLSVLNLNNNNLGTLQADTFSSLTALTSLNLANTGLSTLPAGVFDGLTLLDTLRLHTNPITTPLPANIFSDLPAGEVIHIDLESFDTDEVVLGDGDTRTLDLSNVFISRDGGGISRTLSYTIVPSAPSVATASVSANMLTITGNGIGTTMISITADDDPGVNARDNVESIIAVRVEGVMSICDRTATVESAILAAISPSPACDDVTMTQLANITSLTLDSRPGALGADTPSLQSGDFAGLSGLIALGINRNTLSALPADIFSGLSNLETLSLADNMLTALPDGIFSDLTSLTALRLQNNNFAASTPLPADLFEPLPDGVSISIDLSPIGSDFPDIALTVGTTTTINIANAFVSIDPTSGERDLTYTITPGGSSVSSATESGGVVTITANDRIIGPAMVDVSIAADDGTTTRTRLVTVVVSDIGVDICDRTPEIQTAILAAIPSSPACADVTAGQLAAINSLNVSGITIAGGTLSAGDFAGLSGLTTLNLRGTQLTTVPSGAFTGLTSLTTLSLWSTGLTALPADLFDPLSTLTTLNLQQNAFTTLPDDLFDDLTSITALNLNNNMLSALPSSLSALTTLTTLNLNNNSLGTLESDVFSMLTALTSLNLANTGLSALPDGLFDGLTLLATLRLHGNTFTTPLPSELFDDLPTGTGTLVQINLAPIGDIAVALDTSGARTITLSDVFISRNNMGTDLALSYVITTPPNTAVATVGESGGVLTITAAGNGTTTVGVTASDGVSANFERVIPITVEGTMSICDRTDEVEAVILAAIPGTPACDAVIASQLAAITTLDLEGMSISTLQDGDFAGLSSLTFLNLNTNNLRTLPARVFAGLTSLTELQLVVNPLTALPIGLFNGLTNLSTLYLPSITMPLPADIFEPLPSDAMIFTPLIPIGDHAVALNTGGTTTIDLEETFISRNGLNNRDIAYGAVTSNDTNVATVTRSGLIVTIRAVGTGTTTVSITANDGFGDLTRTIPVTVSNMVVGVCSRTAQVRDSILFNIPVNVACGAVTAAQLANIRSLVVSGTAVMSLQANDFAGLSGLTSLNLTSTSLSTLPANLFDGLTRLSMLRLQGNTFTTALPFGIFDPLPDGVLIEIGLSSFDHPTVVFGGVTTLDLSEVFIARDSDGNDRPLIYTVMPMTDTAFTAGESGGVLTITALAASFTATLSVTADDDNGGANANVTQTIPIRVETVVDICSRSAEVQSAILAAIPINPACGNVTASQLAAITGTLDLSSMSISALLPGDFAGLSGVTVLNLINNSLSTLPDDIFDPLTSLTELYLDRNPLTALPDGVFDELTNLTILTFGGSSSLISTLPAGLFDQLTSLATLGLGLNAISALEPDVFSMLTNLTFLSLQNNELTALPAGLFDGLTNLATLILFGNTITTPLPTDIFDPLPDGAVIQINPTAIGVLPDIMLTVGGETTINVASAFISRQGISGEETAVNYSVTSANPAIATASVSGEVVTISKIIFGTTTISITATDSFDMNSATQTVTVMTPDTTVGICDRTAEVQSVILAAISATNDCAAVTVGQLARITGNLFFPASTLSAALLPGDFDGLTGLTQLNLNSNTLGTLPSGIFDDLISLTSLGIAATELTALDADVFASLTSLTTLIANDNMLSALPAGLFEGLTSLATLQLHDNTITTPLPADIFDPLPATGRIQIDATPIGILPDIALMVGGTTTINVSNAFIHRNAAGNDVGREYGFVSSDATVASVSGGGANGITTIRALTNGATTITARISDTGVGNILATRPIKVTVDASVMDICDRTPEIETAILAAIPSPTPPCNGVTPAQLAAITGTLNLASMSISTLQADDFDGLSGLTGLNLFGNSISTLPDGLFDDLASLETLNLGTNSLTLSSNIFDDLTSLTTLDLIGNFLSALPPNAFAGLNALTTLDLDFNSLSTLPPGIFDPLTSLEILRLGANSLSALPDNVFDNLTNLTNLQLGANSLRALPSGVFNMLSNLTTLFLNDNSLTTLEANAFTGLTSLPVLGLQNNSIATINANAFSGLSGVTELNLSGNNLTMLAANAFTGLSALTTLNLQNNSIATINANAFSGLSGVTELNLRDNDLTMLSANAFNALTNLKTLNLRGNALTMLAANAFTGLGGLTELNLNFNSPLTALPNGLFNNLTNLERLRLNDNSLTALPTGVFDNLTNLTFLTVANNSLTAFPDGIFSRLSNLDQLEITGNNFPALPANLFDGLDSLTTLFMGRLPATIAPLPADIFDPLPDGVGIGVFLTPIGDIPDITLTVGGITTINIANTFISSDAFTGPRTITYGSGISGGVVDSGQSGTVVTLQGTAIGTGNFQISASAPSDSVKRRNIPVTVTEVVDICNRTAQVRDAILAAIPSPTPACADVFATQLAAIDSLDLSGSITSLKIGDFDRLSGLTSLDLSGNSSLNALPDGLFNDLTSLTTLSLNNNALSALEADVFSTLTSLTSLTLHANALTALPDGLFSGLGSLATLRLQGNTFTTALPTTLFDDLPSDAVIEIDLSPFGDLADISSLTVGDSRMVDVSGAFISKDAMGADRPLSFTATLTGTSVASVTVDAAVITITASTTPGAASVAVTANDGRGGTLGMSTRSFAVTVEDMTVDICDRTDAVETAILTAISATSPPACDAVTATQLANITGALNLQSMSISTLSTGDFDGLTGLTELRLFDNSLSALPDNIFNDLRNLTLLSLSLNRIAMLPTGVFDNLTSLTGLFLAGNSLSALNPNVFSTLTSLTTLDLGSNDLSTLPANLFDMLSNLTTLRLNGNDLSALPDGLFSGLGSLATLRLQGNTFTTRLPADIFNDLADFEATGRARLQIDLSPIGDLPSIPSLTLGGVTTINVSEAFISRDSSGVDRTLTYLSAVTGTSVSVARSGGVVTITASSTITGTSDVGIIADDGVGMLSRTVAVTVVDTLVNICSRTAEVQTVILAAIPGSTTCDAVTESQLAAITGVLFLDSMGLTTLLPGDLAGLSGVTSLFLDDNTLTTLPSGIFSDLGSLSILSLDGSGLATLPAGAFSGLTSLATLNLEDNALTALPAGLFTGLTSLTELNLSRNALTTLPANAFSSLTSLTTLFLDTNDLSTIDANAFSGLTSVGTLDLTGNSLTALPAGLFTGLTSLASLRLTGNTFTTPLPATIFDPLPATARIRIDLSPIGNLADVMSVINTETALDVTDAFISGDATGNPRTITYSATSVDTSVATVILSAGGVGTITAGSTPDTMTAINIVADDDAGGANADVTRTITVMVLPDIVNICSRTAQVETAILTAISATSPPACDAVTSTQLAGIGSLDLSGDGISTLQANDFVGLSGLTTLNLSSNTLSTLPANLFSGLTSLTTLFLGSNMLSALPVGVFDPLTSLTSLNLFNNTLSTLPVGVFDNLGSLLTLVLEDNNLSALSPGVFNSLTMLTALNLNGNDLDALPDNVFDNLGSLLTLNLGVNQISALDADVFSSLTSLTSLFLDENNFAALPAGLFSGLGSLATLRLNGNTFTTALPTGLFDDLPTGTGTLVQIDLAPIGDLADIPSLTVSGTTTVTVSDAFISRDSSGDPRALSFTVTPVTPAVATASESGGVVTIRGIAAGTTDVTVTATDVSGTATQTISVTVVNVGIVAYDAMSAGNQISTVTIADENSGTAMFYVELQSAPVGDVILSVTSDDTAEGTVLPATLTFTTANWNTRQAITVTAVDDSISDDDSFMVDFAITTGDGGNYLTTTTLSSVTVAITDDETVPTTITLSGVTPLTVAETADATEITITATIDGTALLPTDTIVTVSVGGGMATSGTDYTAVPDFTLTIPALSLSATGTFMIDPTEDSTNDNNETVMINGTAGGFTTINPATLTIVEAGISAHNAMSAGNRISTVTIDNENSGTMMFYVELLSPPVGDVILSVTSDDTNEGTVLPATLTFTTGNWNTRQAITVTAVDDNIVRDDSFMVNFAITTGDGGNYETTTTLSSVTVEITDNETAPTTITLSGVTPLTVAETADATTITITATIDGTALLPTDTIVTVSVGGGTATSGNDYTAVPNFPLTIPALSLSATGTFMIDPTDDGTGDNNETVMITGTAGGFTVNAVTLDIVEAGISVHNAMTAGDQITTATIAEASGTTMFYVQLLSAPASDVIISATSDDTNEGTVSSPTLTFTATNWATRQALTITAVPDDIDRDDTFTVNFAVMSGDSGNYTSSLTLPSVTVTVTDDDTVGIALFDAATGTDAPSITTTEGATDDSFYVVLESEPTGTVTVTISGLVAGEHTLDPVAGTLTFTPTGATAWNTRQEITLTGVDDVVVDGDQMYDLTLTPTGGGYDSVTAPTVSVTNEDDDTAALTITNTTISVNEDAGTAEVTVTLTPAVTAGPVTVDATTTDGTATAAGGDYTAFTSETLTFMAGSTTQTLNIPINDDNIDEIDETFTVTLDNLMLPAAVTGDVSITDDTATITITDDDMASTTINLSINPATIVDTADATTITVTATLDTTVVLTTETDVMVTVGESGDSAVEGTDYATVAGFTLTIPALSSSGMATFMIDPETSSMNNATVTIDGTATGFTTVNTATLTIVEAGILVFDADSGGASINTITIAEASGTDTLYVQLASAPAGNVTLSVESDDTNEGTVTPATLTFSDTNWNTRQALTITAVPDNVDRDGDSFMLGFDIATVGDGDGVNYTNLLDLSGVMVTIADDDTAASTIDLSVSPSTVAETADATTITVTATIDGTVVLSTETDVMVTVGESGDSAVEGTDYAEVADFPLTIPALSSSATQTFMITPTDDGPGDNNETVTIDGTAMINGMAATVTATTLTIVEAGILAFEMDSGGTSTTTATIADEASGTGTLYVQLASPPATGSSVTISVTSDDTNEGMVTPATLTFSDTDWNTRQALTITAVDDSIDRDGDSFMVDFEIMSGDGDGVNYTNSLDLSGVMVTITDDDTASDTIALSVSPLTVAETAGATDITVTAALEGTVALPTATDVAVTVGSGTGTATVTADYTATPSTLTITIPALMTSATQMFTITPVDDGMVDNNETITISGTSGSLTVNPATLTIVEAGISVHDAMTAGNPISTTTIAEASGTDMLYVQLASQPAGNVTLSVASSDTNEGTVSAPTLTFSDTNWDTRQLITVTAVDDNVDRDGDSFTVDFAVMSGDGGNYTSSLDLPSVAVTITDDDDTATNTINLSVSPDSIQETASATTITVTATIVGATSTMATDVTVTVGGTATNEATVATDYTATPTTLTITIPALMTSNTGTFRITPVADNVSDNGETITISGTSGSLTVNPATLTIDEAGISVHDAMSAGTEITTTTIAEASGTDMLYVQLASQPAGNVTLSVASSDTNEGTVSTPTLTFSDTNWDTRQALTVTAVPDNIDRDDSFTVDFAVMSGDGGNYTSSLMLPSVTVLVTDDDDTAANTINLSVSPDSIQETAGETTITVTATLVGATSTMATDVTVTVGGGTATVTTDYTATPSTLTITVSTLMTSGSGTFRITPVADDVSDNGETITISGTSGSLTVNPATLTINEAGILVFDAMTAGSQISTTTIAEASGTDMLYVQLASQPAGNVTLSVASSDTNEGTVSTPALTFSDTNWDDRQLITVTAVPDNVDRDDTFMVDFAVMSGDSANYTTSLTLPSVTVLVTDDDDTTTNTINLSVSPDSIQETAGETTITVTATLVGAISSTMATDVTVTVGGGTATVTTDYTATPSTLTITVSTLMTSGSGTFRITPVADDVSETPDETITISGVSGSLTVNPATLTILEAGISVFDAMTAGTEISTVTIAEASGTDMLYVQLASQPAGNVTLSVASSDTNEGTVSTPALTFSDTNWDDRQLITVTAVPDNVDRDDSFTVDFAVMSGDGANYTTSLDLPSVAVTITDDDTAANTINLSVSPDSIQETAGETTITVTATLVGATSTMATDVTVTVGGTATNEATVTTDYTATPSTLTVTIPAEATSGDGTFAITPVADDVSETPDETITISGESGSLTVNPATLTIDEFSEEEQQAIEQTVAAATSGITQVVTEQIGVRLASRTLAGSVQERQSLSLIDWQDRLAKFTYEGLKHLDSEADMSLDWLMRAAGGDGQLVMPLGVEALTLWATGGRISTKGDGVADYDGDVNSLILGIDTALSNDWLAGIAVSYNDSEVDYTMDGTPEAKNELTLYAIHPYLSYTLSQGLTLWGTVGYGFGDVDFSHSDRGQATSDVTQWMAAGGLEQQIITNTPWQGALRIKGLWGNAEVDAATYDRTNRRINKVDTDFWRAHMESEMGYNFQLPGGKIRPYALIGGRWDHNDATIVSGDEWHVDVGGGVEVIRPAFTLNISVRTQVTEGDTEEDSIFATGSLTYDLEQDGRGLQIALSRPLNNTSPAWDSHSFSPLTDTESGLSGAPLTSELAYGWTVHPFGLKGALQTYVQNSFDNDDRHYAVGLELAVNALTLNFETGYHTNLDSETDGTGLESMLKTKIRW